MADDAPRLTVIIITKDRADELRRVSLPSLVRQTYKSFDVLVWDASSEIHTQNAVADAALRDPWMRMRHVRAQRPGTSCQRNDALDDCKSDLVLFIDDDLELFPTAIAELMHVFEADNSGHIAGCQCTLVGTEADRRAVRTIRNAVWQLWYGFWGMWHIGSQQAIRLSGFDTVRLLLPQAAVERTPPGVSPCRDLGWLQGCAMAFRRRVLSTHHLRFDERLMRFGSYGKCEDVLFSGILHMRYGYDLARAPSALAIHHQGSGLHGATASQPAMIVYNHWLVWRELLSSRRWAHLALGWAHIGLWLRYLLPALLAGRTRDLVSFREGLRATREPSGNS